MTTSPDAAWTKRAAKAILLIRIFVGWVFLLEGIQKFLFPDALGVGRFVKIGIPWPQVTAPFVGVVEIVCGSLLLIGLMTRLAAIPLLIDICVALYSTKIVTLAKNGFWGTLHEARTGASMLLRLIFVLLIGGGAVVPRYNTFGKAAREEWVNALHPRNICSSWISLFLRPTKQTLDPGTVPPLRIFS